MTTEAELDEAARLLIPTLAVAADNWERPDDWPINENRLRKLKARRRRLADHLQDVEVRARTLWNDYHATANQITEIEMEIANLETVEEIRTPLL